MVFLGRPKGTRELPTTLKGFVRFTVYNADKVIVSAQNNAASNEYTFTLDIESQDPNNRGTMQILLSAVSVVIILLMCMMAHHLMSKMNSNPRRVHSHLVPQ